MRILFVGTTKGNTGPSNVNRKLRANLSGEFMTLHSKNKYLACTEGVLKLLVCRTLVLSGISRQGVILSRAAKFLRRKVVYIMHGCAEYEVYLDKIPGGETMVEWEKAILAMSDLILPVSKRYMLWLKREYPALENKLNYLYNGVEKPQIDTQGTERIPGRLLAIGGNRVSKNNRTVANAVEPMAGAVQLRVFGKIWPHLEIPDGYAHTQYIGLVDQQTLYRELAASEVFILNSLIESFSLSVIDALSCGCSVLVTNVAGIVDLLDLRPEDIIFDPMNTEEIAEKIWHVLQKPNNERILKSLDYGALSYEKAAARLAELCRSL